MPVQTTYGANIGAAYEGQDANMLLKNITSKVVETAAGINFGRAITRGTADNQIVLPSAAGQDFMGVTCLTSAWSEQADGSHLYEQYREANILDFGEIWVYTETAVDPGDDVFFRHTAEAAPLDIVGRFRNDNSGGNADQVTNATFETTAAAGALAKIRLLGPR